MLLLIKSLYNKMVFSSIGEIFQIIYMRIMKKKLRDWPKKSCYDLYQHNLKLTSLIASVHKSTVFVISGQAFAV
jgi:hypothetical protein